MRRSLVLAAVIVLALGLCGAAEFASAKQQAKATLKVSVPASVATEASYSITVTGRSGDFNTLAFVAFPGSGCKKTVSAEAKALGLPSLASQPVHKQRAFKVPHGAVGQNPGIHQACAYLYNSREPSSGKQLESGMTYQVTP